MTAQPVPRLVVLGWGNVSRGDDAIGPMLLRQLDALGLPGVRTVEAYQLQIEHALELVGADLVLFIDAGLDTPAPYTLRRVQPGAAFTASTHALSPEAVLEVYRRVHGSAPPEAYVLCVSGCRFGLGEALSDAARDHQAQAWAWLRQGCDPPDVEAWRRMAGP